MTAIRLETENLCLKQILEIKIYNVVVVKNRFERNLENLDSPKAETASKGHFKSDKQF